MLDIHTHILPGMDDGSRSVEQSIAMLECEAAQGVHTIALTPHYSASRESPQSFVKRRAAAQREMRYVLQGIPRIPELLAGAEVAYFDGMCRTEDIGLLCIGNTNAMLIEMPFCKWNRRMLGELEELRSLRGIQPVLAHVERYMSFQPAGLISQLCESGMLIQVNASFVLRWQTAWKAMSMLKRQTIHFVASDCHDTQKRVPNLDAAMRRIEGKLGLQTVEFLKSNAEMLLEG